MAITPYSGTVPNRLSAGDNEAYATQVYEWFLYLDGTWVSTVNSTEVNINAKEASAVAAADTATTAAETATTQAQIVQSAANFKGKWQDLSGALTVPSSVFHNGAYWMLLENIANVSANTPSEFSTVWAELETIQEVARPTPIAPLNGAINVNPSPTLEASGYLVIYSGDVRANRIFEVDLATGDFTTPVYTFSGDVDSHTVVGTLPLETALKWRCKDVSLAGRESQYSTVQNFSTGATSIVTPTLTVTGTPTDVPETPTLETSAFAVVGGSDTHLNTDWQILNDQLVVVWESLADATNKLSITVPAGILETSKTYTFRGRHRGTTYGVSAWATVTATTKSAFGPAQGQKGFGIEPLSDITPFAVLGLAKMAGTDIVGHDNYGNYIHTNGSIVCHYIKKYYRVGHPSSPRYAVYGANALDMEPASAFANEAAANAAGYVLHRTFIDGGAEKSGFLRDKYLNSKKSDNANVAVSVKNGNPIGLTTNATYTPSSTMTGCTGILADAITLCRARGAGWNNESVFMVGWSAMISIAQAQAATSAADVAWYDATKTTNFPKGCNNGSRQDVNDTSVSWTASPDTAAKGLTGSASNFAKSTDNGANNGCADVNGLMYQVALGMTNAGANATDSAAIATNTLYVLKKSSYLKDLTAGWNGATDAWGNAGSLATRYDAVTSPITISAGADSKWGNGANQVLSSDVSGVAHDLCGFLPKNDAATDVTTGTSQFGNDRMYKYNVANMYPYTAGNRGDSANAGVFCRDLNYIRSAVSITSGFRAAAYVA